MDLDLLKTPGPTVTALTAPFWKAAEEGRLSIQRCEACEQAIFYPRGMCPHCWSKKLVWQDASGKGRLKTFSLVHMPGHPAWKPITPYAVGLVTLAEGPTMLSFIHLPARRPLEIGEDLVLAPTRIGGRVLPAFKTVK